MIGSVLVEVTGLVAAITGLIAAVGVIITAILGKVNKGKIEEVHSEVKNNNKESSG